MLGRAVGLIFSYQFYLAGNLDGGGYVAHKKADYAHARSRSDTDVQMYLFESFGGSGCLFFVWLGEFV